MTRPSQATSTYSLQPNDIFEFEKRYGKITEGAFVIIYTGWGQYWALPQSYCNNHMFPSVSPQAANLLIERNIVGLGIDTLSPDRPGDGFQAHQILLGNGKYIVENVANAQQLPAVGSFTFALPIKTAGVTEAPIRLIGLVRQE
jgi:kynurenine formamidase